MPYLPDGVTEYDTQPDPLDHRRASRARFAAACLPVFIGIGVLGKIVLWLAQTCADGCRFAFGSRIGGAMSVLLLAIFFPAALSKHLAGTPLQQCRTRLARCRMVVQHQPWAGGD